MFTTVISIIATIEGILSVMTKVGHMQIAIKIMLMKGF